MPIHTVVDNISLYDYPRDEYCYITENSVLAAYKVRSEEKPVFSTDPYFYLRLISKSKKE